MYFVSIILAVTGGILMAIQSPTNTELSKHVGNCQAAWMSFTGGLIILIVAVATIGNGSLGMIVYAKPWMCIGGLFGAFLVLIVTFVAPSLGIALTLTLIMLGQLIMGIIIDLFGLFMTESIPISWLRIVGCLVVTAGILFVNKGRTINNNNYQSDSKGVVCDEDVKDDKCLESKKEQIKLQTLILALAAFVAGALCAIQTPANSALAGLIGKIESSMVNFTVGTVALFIVTLIVNKGKLNRVTGVKIKPWMLLGGLYGSCCIFLNIVIMPYIGVVLITIGTMFGQLVGGIIIDSNGLLRSKVIKMNSHRIIGIILIGIGIIFVSVAKVGM